jgi:hypothetical protein
MSKVKAGYLTVVSEHMYRRDSPKRMSASAFLSNIINELGEHMPDTDQIHLPQATKRQVHNLFLHHCTKYSETSCTYEYFRLLWVNDFPHVKTPKSKRFAKCVECADYLKKLKKTTIQSDKVAIREAFNNHMDEARKERLDYHARRLRSKTNPEEILCIIIDGMDQSKTDLPHWRRDTKRTEQMQKCKTHVMGAIAHGHGSYVSVCPPWVSDNGNLTSDFLRKILLDISSRDGYVLPPKLSLQLDSASVNKNKSFMAFLSLLVESGVFKEVQVNFLIVGHTHEDIDQMFSCFSRALRQNDAYTFDEMYQIFQGGYSPAPVRINISEIPDWDRYCANWRPKSSELCGMANERVFLIRRFSLLQFTENHLYDLRREVNVSKEDVEKLFGRVQLVSKWLSTDASFCIARQKNFGCFNTPVFPPHMFYMPNRHWPLEQFRETTIQLKLDWDDSHDNNWKEWLHEVDEWMADACTICVDLCKEKQVYTKRQKDKLSLSKEQMREKDVRFRNIQKQLAKHLSESPVDSHDRYRDWTSFLGVLGNRYLPQQEQKMQLEPVPLVAPVHTGRVGSRNFLHRDATSLTIGDLLIVHCIDVTFAICQLLSVSDNKMLVHWWGNPNTRNTIPALSGNINPLLQTDGGGPYTEELDMDTSVIAYGFELTKGKKLPHKTLRIISNDSAVDWQLPNED